MLRPGERSAGRIQRGPGDARPPHDRRAAELLERFGRTGSGSSTSLLLGAVLSRSAVSGPACWRASRPGPDSSPARPRRPDRPLRPRRRDGAGLPARTFLAVLTLTATVTLTTVVLQALSAPLRRLLTLGPLSLIDRLLGAIASVVVFTVLLWLLIPTAAASRVASAARSGPLRPRAIDALPHASPTSPAPCARLLGGERFPDVFASLAPTPEPSRPAGGRRDRPAVLERIVSATRGPCRRLRPHLLRIRVRDRRRPRRHQRPRRRRWSGARPQHARRAHASPRRSSSSTRTATSRCCTRPATDCRRSSSAAGRRRRRRRHRLSRADRSSPASLRQHGSTVRHRRRPRHLRPRRDGALAPLPRGELRSGDSGAAVVGQDGRVVGAVFAVSPDVPTVAYALPSRRSRRCSPPRVTRRQRPLHLTGWSQAHQTDMCGSPQRCAGRLTTSRPTAHACSRTAPMTRTWKSSWYPNQPGSTSGRRSATMIAPDV
jgi:hypothetical protein